MSYKERLEKMIASGVITTDQAKGLQDSIGKGAPQANAPAHKAVPAGVIAGSAGVIAVFLMITLFLSSGGEGQEVRQIQDVSESLNQIAAMGGLKGTASSFMALVILGLPLIAAFAGYMPFVHNRFVTLEEEMLASWAHVESCYQKRADLLPNLAETVRSYLRMEKGVQSDVTQARAGQENLAAALKEFEQIRVETVEQSLVRDQVVPVLGKLFAVMENYPDLKAAENISLLQHQLEDIESQINAARIYYNEAARDYNRAIGKVPGNLVATMGGFQPRPYFEGAVASSTAEKIELAA
ncbi:MAG: LemA family protein [Rhodospirillales bacterium]|nr:LemA family protein [Rhodospirillales bacterium]